jgi:hypothetical protein
MKKFFKVLGWFILIVIIFFALAPKILSEPSLVRDWTNDQKILSHTTFNDDGTVSISNVRNIDYVSTSTYTPHYYDATYDTKKIKRAWLMLEDLKGFGVAHTLVSFEFEDGRFVSVSAEIRKEKGETFSPLSGLLGKYELVYVVADERDVIRLRTNYRKDPVRLYPIKGDSAVLQEVFLDMLKRANTLSEDPELYNTVANNCTTNIISHVKRFSEKDIPWWNFRYTLPETIDSLAYDLGMIDTELSLEDARQKFFITERAQKYDKDKNFSKLIRQ